MYRKTYITPVEKFEGPDQSVQPGLLLFVIQISTTLNPFITEFLKWTLPSLNLDTSILANRGSVRNQLQNDKMANSEDPDETAHNEPSHQDLHCLQKHLFWAVRLKRLILPRRKPRPALSLFAYGIECFHATRLRTWNVRSKNRTSES